MNSGAGSDRLAVIAIGRNEGERLKVCLHSAMTSGLVDVVVYVDSGSADGSTQFARDLGCEVVDLDMSVPFTAARARNEGLARALQAMPHLTYVQFVDGDCELVPDWLCTAKDFLNGHSGVAVVCGRRRERHPEKSIYNQLCDIEWNTPVGNAKSCGGDALMRVDAIQAVGAFRSDLIAGEEPELCVRLRAAGWRIWRLDHEMVLHDAAMVRFGQWWRRTMRGGYAFAQGTALHGAPPERHWVRESRSAVLWGAGIPLAVACFAIVFTPWALLLLWIYPLQVLRLYWRARRSVPRSGWHATFLVMGKFPEALGAFKYFMNRMQGKSAGLIEYK